MLNGYVFILEFWKGDLESRMLRKIWMVFVICSL